MNRDRRRLPRSEHRHSIRFCRVDQGDGNVQLLGSTIDASEGGLRLEAGTALQVGETLTLEIDADPNKRPILAVGEVAWCQVDEQDPLRFQVGVELLWIDSGTWSDQSSVVPQNMWSFL